MTERTSATPVSPVADVEITTLAGLGTPEHLHPLRQAHIDEQYRSAATGVRLRRAPITPKRVKASLA